MLVLSTLHKIIVCLKGLEAVCLGHFLGSLIFGTPVLTNYIKFGWLGFFPVNFSLVAGSVSAKNLEGWREMSFFHPCSLVQTHFLVHWPVDLVVSVSEHAGQKLPSAPSHSYSPTMVLRRVPNLSLVFDPLLGMVYSPDWAETLPFLLVSSNLFKVEDPHLRWVLIWMFAGLRKQMMMEALDDLAFIYLNSDYPRVRDSHACVRRRLRAATGHRRMFAAWFRNSLL